MKNHTSIYAFRHFIIIWSARMYVCHVEVLHFYFKTGQHAKRGRLFFFFFIYINATCLLTCIFAVSMCYQLKTTNAINHIVRLARAVVTR